MVHTGAEARRLGSKRYFSVALCKEGCEGLLRGHLKARALRAFCNCLSSAGVARRQALGVCKLDGPTEMEGTLLKQSLYIRAVTLPNSFATRRDPNHGAVYHIHFICKEYACIGVCIYSVCTYICVGSIL